MQRKGFTLFLIFISFSICSGIMGYGQIDRKTPGVKADSSFSEKQTGFYNVTTLSVVTFTGQFLPGIQTICGYKINKYLSVGGGVGYEYYKSLPTYDNFEADLSLLPVFADIRLTPLTGRITPVIAVDAGYKIVLKKTSTQVRYDTVYSNTIGVESRNNYADSNIYTSGGPFITGEIGVRALISKKVGVYLSVAYSLWSISGTYYLSDKQELLGSAGWVAAGKSEPVEKSLAYVHAFLLRFGITF